MVNKNAVDDTCRFENQKKKKGCGLKYNKKLLTTVLKSAGEIRRAIPDGFDFSFEIGRLAGVADDTAGAAHPKEETKHPTEEQNIPLETLELQELTGMALFIE